MKSHLPNCTSLTLAEMYPGESKPADMPHASWYEIEFQKCADGCPVLARTLERGRELFKEHGL